MVVRRSKRICFSTYGRGRRSPVRQQSGFLHELLFPGEKTMRAALILSVFLIVPACGGGSGDGDTDTDTDPTETDTSGPSTSTDETGTTGGPPSLEPCDPLADNACACLFIQGAPAASAWRDLNLAEHRVALFRNGKPDAEGCGANVLGDPRLALTWLANELLRFGEFLRAGQIITTGTCSVPMPLEDGLEVAADFGGLGRLGARFVR